MCISVWKQCSLLAQVDVVWLSMSLSVSVQSLWMTFLPLSLSPTLSPTYIQTYFPSALSAPFVQYNELCWYFRSFRYIFTGQIPHSATILPVLAGVLLKSVEESQQMLQVRLWNARPAANTDRCHRHPWCLNLFPAYLHCPLFYWLHIIWKAGVAAKRLCAQCR